MPLFLCKRDVLDIIEFIRNRICRKHPFVDLFLHEHVDICLYQLVVVIEGLVELPQVDQPGALATLQKDPVVSHLSPNALQNLDRAELAAPALKSWV